MSTHDASPSLNQHTETTTQQQQPPPEGTSKPATTPTSKQKQASRAEQDGQRRTESGSEIEEEVVGPREQKLKPCSFEGNPSTETPPLLLAITPMPHHNPKMSMRAHT